MKRYVKEFHKDMINKLFELQSERNEEYLFSRTMMDGALDNAERGLITDYEAIKTIVSAYELVY